MTLTAAFPMLRGLVLILAGLLCGPQLIWADNFESRQAVRINLELVASGFSQPVLLTNARDGTNRLFVVEQTGKIKLLKPGASSASVLLDITAKLVSGGEQGLLGLAFHPAFRSNGRFFVNYTRRPDGATIVAEYRVSEANPDAAAADETVLLTIAQPFTNHNGGMLEFGPDGYLYIGMGDGGSANDPGNRAQNLQELLGKILRIDVNRAEAGRAYAIPADNPFAGSSSGRGEIFALGLRNPWRFSFDRSTGLLYAGDVGQNAVEEIDIVRRGGNYGWRILEGTRCTNLGPGSCSAGGFEPPLLEYSHTQGRCSVTGGYVYRGLRGSLPSGSYVFGDYCTGEVFLSISGKQALLASTGLSITSFGEDEEGEIYVVGQSGTVHRITNADAPAAGTWYLPRLATNTVGRAPGREEFTSLAVTNLDLDPASLTFTAFDRAGGRITGPGVTNPRTIELTGGSQLARIDTDLFGPGWLSLDRVGWIRLESTVRRLAAFFLAFDTGLNMLDGADFGSGTMTDFILPEVESSGFTEVRVVNPGSEAADLTFELHNQLGGERVRVSRRVPAGGVLVESFAELFPGLELLPTDFVRGSANQGVVPLELLGGAGRDVRTINGLDASAGATVLWSPQYVTGGGYRSAISINNLDPDPGTVTLRFIRDGEQQGTVAQIPIVAGGKLLLADPALLGAQALDLVQGFVEIRTSGIRIAGSIAFSDSAGAGFAAALPLVSASPRPHIFSQVASDETYFTGLAIVNPGAVAAAATIEVFDREGARVASGAWPIPAGGRICRLLTQYFPLLVGRSMRSGYFRISADRPTASIALFGTTDLRSLAAIP